MHNYSYCNSYIIHTETFTTNTASEISTVSPTATMITTEDSQRKIVCQPPDNEMANDSYNIPARKRQRQTYLTIMSKTRFNKVCNNLVGINTGTISMILTPQLNNFNYYCNKSIMMRIKTIII